MKVEVFIGIAQRGKDEVLIGIDVNKRHLNSLMDNFLAKNQEHAGEVQSVIIETSEIKTKRAPDEPVIKENMTDNKK